MNCCGCNKQVIVEMDENNKPQSFGKYKGNTCIKVICNECIQDPKKKEAYKK